MSFSTQSMPSNSSKFTWTLSVQHVNRDYFQQSHISPWAAHGQPPSHILSIFFGTEMPSHFWPHTSQPIHFTLYHASNTHGQFLSKITSRTVFNSPQKQCVRCPWTTPSSTLAPLLWNRNPWPFSASQHPKPFSWLFKQEITK